MREENRAKLVELLDSKDPCAATVKAGSSVLPPGSTVGHEAAALLDSFRTGKAYPMANTSTEHQVDREALLKWGKGLEKKPK